MYKTLWTSVVAATMGLALLLTPATSEARGHGGGGHGGGGHGGGGYHGGGYRGGGGYHGGYARGGWGGWGLGLGWGWGYPGYYGWGGGYYPGYYSSPYYYSDYDYGTPVTSDSGSYSYYPSDSVNQVNNQANMNQNDARFVVRVPDGNAEVWFQNHQTKQRGQVRFYESDNLDPNSNYTFTVKSRWNQNGQQMEQTRKVNARAGQVYNVDFNRPAGERIPTSPNVAPPQQIQGNSNNNVQQPIQRLPVKGTNGQRPVVNPPEE